MRTDKLISIARPIAIAILLLGIIHDIATFSPFIQDGLRCVSIGTFDAMTYMSLICGLFFVLSGLLLVMLLGRVKQHQFLISPILTISIFTLINGLLAVFYMFDNPFAWAGLFFSLSIFCMTLAIKKSIKNR